MNNEKQILLIGIKNWWNESGKDNHAIDKLLNRNITINGYNFFLTSGTSGHRAFINAKNNLGIELSIIDCGNPYTQSEVKSNLMTILNKNYNILPR